MTVNMNEMLVEIYFKYADEEDDSMDYVFCNRCLDHVNVSDVVTIGTEEVCPACAQDWMEHWVYDGADGDTEYVKMFINTVDAWTELEGTD